MWLLFACAPALAQNSPSETTQVPETAPFTAEMLSSYNGQRVTAVQIAGHPGLDTAQFAPLLTQKAGQPFSEDKVKESAAALKAKGKYQAVRIQIDPEANGIRVVLVPEPAVYFGVFEFPGARRFPYSRLLQVSDYPTRTAFNAADVEADRQSLVNFFREQGYFHVTVDAATEVDKVHAVANVLFHVSLGRRAKFGAVRITGASPANTASLEKRLRSLRARLHGAAIRPGKTYHHSTLVRAQRYLHGLLEKKGYLGAQVALSGADYDAATNRASIDYNVKPGPVTRVRVEGAHLWGWTRRRLLPVYQGVGVDEDTVREGRQALVSRFQAKGYFDAEVTSQLVADQSGDTIVYKITKGKKHRVTAVRITGNSHISSAELMPQIAVQAKHLFSRGKFSERLVNSSASNLRALYQSEGYSDAEITPQVTRKAGNIRVTFQVTEGPQDIVNSLTVEGNRTLPESKFAPQGLKLAAGGPYSQARIEADRAEVIAHYLQDGYLTASFRETATEASKSERHRINVVYHIYEGPKVTTNEVLTLGRKRTQERLIQRDVAVIRPGLPLTESHMLTAGTELYNSTGVFDWAQVDPKRPITTQNREDVLVKVHEAKRNTFTYGIGFELVKRGGSVPSGTIAIPTLPPVGLPSTFTTSEKTFYGPRGTAQYTRNNLFGKGVSLSATAFAGRLNQRGAVYYIDPSFLWTAWNATASYSFQRDEENPIFSYRQNLTSFQLQKTINRSKTDLLFLRYTFSHTILTNVLIPALVPQEDRNVRLSTLAANLTRDTRDNPLNEHSGVLRSLELDLNTTKLGSSVNFAKLFGQVAFYKEKYHHIVWADSVRMGLEQPFAGSFVPLSERYFTGGANSLRGFPLDGAGPQRSVEVCPDGTSGCGTLINVPKGGNELLILNSEARIPLPFKKGLRIVPFYDGGNVFPNVGFHDFLSLYSNNVGIGLRYNTPVGPIRFDVGHNLNPVQGVSSTQYFISIGQAF